MAGKLTVRLENRLDEIQRVDTAIEEFTEQLDLSFSDVFQIRLVVEELFTNIVSYGYDDDDLHEIFVTVAYEEGRIELTLIDDGKEFNPLNVDPHHNEADTIEELEIGGKGWTLVRAYMNEFDYEYSDGKNHLKLVKHLT
ncbi:MAG: ATP-binding protein [Gammaproteobacteria bacterium]|nr:ATP-binding protein [Gammaproteobacteria bacterium]